MAQRVEAIENGSRRSPGPVTTIYMLAGTPREAEGPVRAVLRRFGSFQKGRVEPKAKSSIPKPPRKALSRDKGTLIPSPASSLDSPQCLELSETAALGESSQEEETGRLGGTTRGARGDDLPVLEEAGQLADEPQYENVKPGSGTLNS